MVDIELEIFEKARLAATVASGGFDPIKKILLSEVEKFSTDLLNADIANEAEIVAKHRLAKAAAQICTMVVNRINREIEEYNYSVKDNDKPIDITEGLLDLGETNTDGGDEYDRY